MTVTEPTTGADAGTNWSRNVAFRATSVARPASVAELQELVRSSERIKAVGSRHSFNRIADTDGVLLDLTGLGEAADRIRIDAGADTVRVAPGVTYARLTGLLDERGLALHNLGSLPHITVVGATATSTHGSGPTNGSLATAVVGLELVDGSGELQRIDADDARLQAAVVHLGALGIVTAVTLRTQPRYEIEQTVYRGLSWEVFEQRFDEVMASGYSVSAFTDWRGEGPRELWVKRRVGFPAGLDLEALGASPSASPLHPIPDVDPSATTAQLGERVPWHRGLPHFSPDSTPSVGDELQSEYFVAAADAVDAIRAVRALADRIVPLLWVSEIRTIAGDALWLSTASGRDSVALHFTWRPDEPAVLALLPELEVALAPFDARPHWGKVFAASGAEVAARYERIDDFRALAASFDPDGRFANPFLAQVLRG